MAAPRALREEGSIAEAVVEGAVMVVVGGKREGEESRVGRRGVCDVPPERIIWEGEGVVSGICFLFGG